MTQSYLPGLWDTRSARMKNSTKWCNLYSTESKYKLSFTPSNIAPKVPLYLTVLFLVLFFTLLYRLNASLDAKYIVIIVLTLTLPQYFFLRYLFKQQIKSNLLVGNNVLLSESGELTFAADQHWQITSASFILPFGCSLVLERNSKKLFCWVFKDSLNNRSYRRLCRLVMRQKANV
ncbi:protein YgfX [Thalassomonas sp. M1454]|uniref:protein YgfX n=1 Tax=Thalassomonas sp. M1454 TaxID=2594477 RepID=UPI00117D0704|nr:protein YgfX [Thalassomonas sp. M1454]TRX54536.1 hypothetical protein FNN08_12470 [Thalassomonas sp. M1454]